MTTATERVHGYAHAYARNVLHQAPQCGHPTAWVGNTAPGWAAGAGVSDSEWGLPHNWPH